MDAAVKEYHCLRCDHKWYQRTPDTPTPKRCARCNNPNWETAKAMPSYLVGKDQSKEESEKSDE